MTMLQVGESWNINIGEDRFFGIFAPVHVVEFDLDALPVAGMTT
jgi:hypothetical protein